MSTEFIGLCDHCGIERGEAWESERPCFNSPGEWSARCNGCGKPEITDLEDIVGVKSEDAFECILEIYQTNKEHEDYKVRAKAQGMIELLEVLV